MSRDSGASSFSSFLAAANTAKSNRKAVLFFIGELRASSVTPDVHLLRTMCHCLALDGDLADAEEAFVRLTGSHMLFDYEEATAKNSPVSPKMVKGETAPRKQQQKKMGPKVRKSGNPRRY
ncbi:hypothetical protein DIPPA_01554 [Diplonema papillatum]|nr:hypothetical protein DIPPA_01554 [Diplonema papillatum]